MPLRNLSGLLGVVFLDNNPSSVDYPPPFSRSYVVEQSVGAILLSFLILFRRDALRELNKWFISLSSVSSCSSSCSTRWHAAAVPSSSFTNERRGFIGGFRLLLLLFRLLSLFWSREQDPSDTHRSMGAVGNVSEEGRSIREFKFGMEFLWHLLGEDTILCYVHFVWVILTAWYCNFWQSELRRELAETSYKKILRGDAAMIVIVTGSSCSQNWCTTARYRSSVCSEELPFS